MPQIKLLSVSILLVAAIFVSSVASLPVDSFDDPSSALDYATEQQRGASYSDAEVRVIHRLASMLKETPEQLLNDLAVLKLAKQLRVKSTDMQSAIKRGHIWKRSVSSD